MTAGTLTFWVRCAQGQRSAAKSRGLFSVAKTRLAAAALTGVNLKPQILHISLWSLPRLRTPASILGLALRRAGFRQLRCGGHPSRFYIDRFGRLGDHHTPMECPPIDFISRLQIGRQQAVLPLQALDHRAHIVASLHDVMVRQQWLRRGKLASRDL